MGITAAIFGLAFLIMIHEAGHFFVARWVGMTPRKFYLGFGPALVKKTRNGVEYGIAAFPLGGYVKIPGMYRPAAGDLRKSLEKEDQEAVAESLDALDAAMERDDDEAARAQLPLLEEGLGKIRALDELDPERQRPGYWRQLNRTLEELDGALAPDAYWRQTTWKRVAVIAAGPLTNIVFAIVVFAVLFMISSFDVTRTVDRVSPGFPAAKAGLKAGDRIVVVDGARVAPEDIAPTIRATQGEPFTLVVNRDGKRVVIGPLEAKLDQGVYRIGFQVQAVPGPGDSPPRAAWNSVRFVGEVTSDTVKGMARLARGEGTEDVSSAIGIVRVTSDAYQQSIREFLAIVGLISLALAVLNLLPVLPLDGGHIVMALLEKIRGRSFSQLAYLRYSAVGLSLFALLLYFGLRNDLFSGGS